MPVWQAFREKDLKKRCAITSGKKIPGIILISLNDTNLSEFLAR